MKYKKTQAGSLMKSGIKSTNKTNTLPERLKLKKEKKPHKTTRTHSIKKRNSM